MATIYADICEECQNHNGMFIKFETENHGIVSFPVETVSKKIRERYVKVGESSGYHISREERDSIDALIFDSDGGRMHYEHAEARKLSAMQKVVDAAVELQNVWKNKGHGGYAEVKAHIEINKVVDAYKKEVGE